MPTGVVGPGGPGHALTRTRSACLTEVGALPHRTLTAGYYDPIGLPLRSARLHHWLIRTVVADEAAQTGLSCPEPGHRMRAAPHTPRRPDEGISGTPHRRGSPSP